MKNKLFFITMIATLLGMALTACGPAQTSAPPSEGQVATPPPTTASAQQETDPASVIKAFHAAQNAKDIDGAMAFVADDATFKTPTGVYTGADVRNFVQRQVDSNTLVEESDFQVSGDKVNWHAQVTRGGAPVFSGPVEAIVQAGQIKCFAINQTCPDAQAADSTAVIKGYFNAVNAEKMEEALAFFADDGVLIDPFGTFTGKEQIRARLAVLADRNITFETSNFQLDGDTVTWDQKVFRGGAQIDEGSTSAIVQDGKIKQIGESPQAQASPAATQIPSTITDPWGVVVVPKGGAIKIALTGDFTLGFAQDMRLAVQMAITDLGQDIAPGFDLELVEIGDHSSVPWTGAADAIAADPQIAAVIGPTFSSSGLRQTEILDQAHVTMIAASATADELTARGLATLNRTTWNDNEQATAAARFVSSELKLTRAAVVYDDTPYARGLAQAFKAAFEQSGTITDFLMRNVGQSDYGETLEQIAANKPEIIYFAGFPDIIAEFAAAKGHAGLQDVALMGADVLYPTLANAGADAEGAYASFLVLPGSEALDDFIKRLEAQGGQRANLTYSTPAYDALGLLAQALRRLAQVDENGNLVIGRQALAQAVRATSGYMGLTGEITFDEKGERTSGAEVVIYQVQNGGWVQVFPAP